MKHSLALVCTWFVLWPFLSVTGANQTCTAVVIVDQLHGQTCDCFNQNLAGTLCDDLQCVLSSIVVGQTKNEDPDCLKVHILPGNYTIHDFFQTETRLRLIGAPGVSVTFNISDQLDSSLPQFIMHFSNSATVELRDIDFHDSPGIIVFENVSTVKIESCSFR